MMQIDSKLTRGMFSQGSDIIIIMPMLLYVTGLGMRG